MARLPLSQTVDASSHETSWRSSVISLFASTLLQGVAIALLIVVPLYSYSTPAPANPLQLPTFVPVEPPKPVASRTEAPPSDRRTPPTAEAPSVRPPVTTDFVIPAEIPSEIGEEPVWLDTGGVPGGFDFEDLAGQPVLTRVEPEPEPATEPEPEMPTVGIDVRAPKKVVHVNPAYPQVALRARIEGDVGLQAIVDEGGNVVNLQVTKSVPLLDQAAIAAVRQWKYEPTLLRGKPVPVIMSVTVTFRLRAR